MRSVAEYPRTGTTTGHNPKVGCIPRTIAQRIAVGYAKVADLDYVKPHTYELKASCVGQTEQKKKTKVEDLFPSLQSSYFADVFGEVGVVVDRVEYFGAHADGKDRDGVARVANCGELDARSIVE